MRLFHSYQRRSLSSSSGAPFGDSRRIPRLSCCLRCHQTRQSTGCIEEEKDARVIDPVGGKSHVLFCRLYVDRKQTTLSPFATQSRTATGFSPFSHIIQPLHRFIGTQTQYKVHHNPFMSVLCR